MYQLCKLEGNNIIFRLYQAKGAKFRIIDVSYPSLFLIGRMIIQYRYDN